MTPSWFKKAPTLEQIAVSQAVETLECARRKRKSLLSQVLKKIDSIPIDQAVDDLGRDLGNDQGK